MNPIAYRTTSLAIKTLSNLSKARVNLHDTENIPQGAKIFVINHFTRLETFLIPYYLHRLIRQPVWSLASSEFFVGALGRYLESVGAVSTKDPDRDRLIIKTLLTNEAGWVIFPEGRMVKSKKIIEKGRYMVSYAGGRHPPHTGAAHLALRAEFYRQRLLGMTLPDKDTAQHLLARFDLASVTNIANQGTFVVPVNLTYYPLRAQINILNKLAKRLVEDLPERVTEELMTEGAMLLTGVDIDIRFGKPIDVGSYLKGRSVLGAIRNRQALDDAGSPNGSQQIRKTALKITQRYMRSIYSMTTVNHDHVLASLLKHSPGNRIRMGNYRRRAFLAIARDAAPAGVHLHSSLMENQSHLLIDDRYGKLADFVAIAEEKGVISQQPPFLVRVRGKLSTIFDFDRVRIDNPIAVSANEVEPLVSLQKKISRLCWTPGFRLRTQVARLLRHKALQEFEDDYQRYFHEGETKTKKIGRPFLIRGRSRNVGVVLCHGYMAAPEEVRTLATYLGRLGYWVYVPRLKGHGTSAEDLARRSYQEWIHSMEEGYLIMRNVCRKVVLGGFSTGAALALELAARADNVIGVFAISTPLRLQYMTSRLAPVVDAWNRVMDRVHLDDAKMEYVENRPENPHINYPRNPISGVRELERLMDHLEPELAAINVPALVVQSQEDPVVHPKGSERIFNLLGCADKQYMLFNFKRHGILLGEGSERVHRAIGEFVRHVSGVTAPGAVGSSQAEKI
jgi:esterase/lipase/1-acyl-sn-glycerol-3-phosphate acyltransferase